MVWWATTQQNQRWSRILKKKKLTPFPKLSWIKKNILLFAIACARTVVYTSTTSIFSCVIERMMQSSMGTSTISKSQVLSLLMVVMTGMQRVLFLSQSLSSPLPSPPLQYLLYNSQCFSSVNVHFGQIIL